MPAPPDPHEWSFVYDGFEVGARAGSLALLGWLREFLAPWFEVRAERARAGAPCVAVTADAAALSGALSAAEPAGCAVDVFTRDDAQPPWPLVRAAGAGELAVDPRGVLAVGVGRDARSPRVVRVLAAGERPHARLAAMRLLRELASGHALGRGALPVHGAAVADRAGVTLFVGPKEAGKSTLLLHALVQGDTRYVSNDRVFVDAGAQGATVLGMPTIVSLRAGSLPLSPRLGDELASKAWHCASTIAEARAHRRSGERAEGATERWPPGLSPSQLCVLLGVEPQTGGALARIVFPEIARAAGAVRFALRRLAPEEAGARLLANGLVAAGRPATFVSDAAPARGALARAVQSLAALVPCFACTIGPDAYAPPPVWDAIRAAPSAVP